MSSLNQCQFIGNLGADPEIRSFPDGGKVANFRLAVNEKWKDKNGQQHERTEWVSVACFGDGLVGVIERFLRKGSKVYLQGKLKTRKWTDKDGNDRYSTEVVLQGFDGRLVMLDGAQTGERKQSYEDREESHGQVGGGGYDDLDDDIPF